jgi:DNA-binding response OmpR family regulator
MAVKILYADDEPSFLRLVRMFLERKGYTVVTARSGKTALEALAKHPDIGLAILDVMMPEMDGWDTCRAIRQFSRVPILMLTALDDDTNEVFALENGADDFIGKPFSNDVLVSRVKALLRRLDDAKPTSLVAGGLQLDQEAREVLVRGQTVSLTPKEFELLRYLFLNQGNVLARQQILDRIWGYLYEGDPRTLDTHIKSLRAKLGEAGSLIHTIRNTGYSFRTEQK